MKRKELAAFGERVYLVRIEQDMRQEDLARRVGLSRTSIVNIEAGRQWPALKVLLRILRELDCGAEELICL